MKPEIIINGVKIDHKCAHTIQLALYVLADQLDKGALGDTEGAKKRSQKYLVRIGDIMELMRKLDVSSRTSEVIAKKHNYIGSSLDDFLKQEGILEHCEEVGKNTISQGCVKMKEICDKESI